MVLLFLPSGGDVVAGLDVTGPEMRVSVPWMVDMDGEAVIVVVAVVEGPAFHISVVKDMAYVLV